MIWPTACGQACSKGHSGPQSQSEDDSPLIVWPAIAGNIGDLNIGICLDGASIEAPARVSLELIHVSAGLIEEISIEQSGEWLIHQLSPRALPAGLYVLRLGMKGKSLGSSKFILLN